MLPAIRKLLVIGLAALLVMPQSKLDAANVDAITIAATRLTAAEMASAITVADARFETRAGLPHEAVFRLQSCDPNKPEGLCYFRVRSGGDTQARQIDLGTALGEQIILASTNSTLVCGLPFYNGLGIEVGRLVQNVNVTFHTYNGQTPVTMNWGNRNGTYALYPFIWDNLSGPNASPGYGVYVSRGGTAYAQTDGLLAKEPLPGWRTETYSLSIHLTINSGGWWCH